ncbi:MAG: hypothetical protein WCX75_08895, partial [Fibrobacteraceae bacterium]
FFVLERAQNLFGEEKGFVISLLKREAGILFQILQRNFLFARQWIFSADEYMRGCAKKFCEFQFILFEKFGENSEVEIVNVKYSDFASQMTNILDDVEGFCFAEIALVSLHNAKLFTTVKRDV